MQRRDFLGVLGGVAAWPLAVRAQQTRILKVGLLYPGLATSAVARVAAFREGLHNGGIAPGDVEVIVLAAEGDPDRLARLALELVERKVDVLVPISELVHELNVPDAALMRLLKPLELSLEEVEPFHVTHDGGLPRCMCGLEIGSRKRATQAMVGDHLIHPIEAPKMVLVELARLRRAQRAEDPGRISAEDGTVRHVCEARDRQRSRPHAVCESVIGRRLRRNSARSAVRMDIDRDGFAQHIKRGRGGFGRLGGCGRTARPHAAAEHRADRG